MITEAVAGSLFSWVDLDGNTQTLDVDVVLAATDKRSMKLTEHSVEDGSVITDHVVLQPETLNLELLVTQTPFPSASQPATPLVLSARKQRLTKQQFKLEVPPNAFQPGGFLLLSQGARSAIGAVTGALLGRTAGNNTFTGSRAEMVDVNVTASVFQPNEGDRVGAVHDKLVEIMSQVLKVTISFKGRLYLDYLLTEVELVQSFGSAKFKVQAQAFRTVSGVTVSLPDPSDFRTLAKNAKGNKSTKTPDPDPAKRAKTIAAKGFDGGRNYLNTLMGVP